MTATTYDQYRVVREIGRGGMGRVLEGEGPDGARVAIKVMLLPEGLDARSRWETVERFMREARACRALEHRCIPRMHAVGQQDDQFFIVMEYLDGQSVRQLLDLAGPISPERTCQIVGDVCAALHYAHGLGVVHRDIKPDNFVVVRGGLTKLADFGLASIIQESSFTVDGTVLGTYAYMSPEQAKGEKVGPPSDLFSLGASMYEMLTGHRPFPAEGSAVLQQIIHDDPDWALLRALPPNVSFAVKKCMFKDPGLRHKSPAELSAALGAAPGPAAAAPHDAERTVVTSAATAEVGTAAVEPGAAGRTPAAPVGRDGQPTRPQPHVKRCPRCHEPWKGQAAVCWKCGAPDAGMKRRLDDPQRELDKILESMKPKRKPWQFWKR